MFRVVSVIAFLVIGMSNAFAQVPKMEWKEIDKENLKMERFEADTNASAVVLFEKGHVWFDQELELQMERHVRIKILDKKGFDKASISLSYRDDYEQDISKIRGYTYYLEGDDIEREKLRRRDIFEDEISDVVKVKKFTMPRVQPGVIIEYKYSKEIGSAHLLPDWTFQKDIPVIWSKYTAELPEWYSYSQYLKGSHNYYIDNLETRYETKSFRLRVGSRTGRQRSRVVRAGVNMRNYEWIMKDLPALEKQPYVSTIENYRSKLMLQLASIRFPGQEPRQHMVTWGQFVEGLLEHDEFGEVLESSDQLATYAEAVTDTIADTTLKVRALYSAVSNAIDWNSEHGFLTERSLEDVLESKHGSGVEINLLLTQLLREIGLKANPVLLSTRENGQILKLFPVSQQFNHVICMVEQKGEHYLLDAKNPDREFGLLAVSDLNGEGLVIKEGDAEWVDLENRSKTKKVISMVAKIRDDGSIKGEISQLNTGYEATEIREMVEEDGAKEYVREHLLDKLFEVEVDTIETSNLDSPELPLKTKTSFSAKGDTKVMNDYIYINPNFLLRRTENPFKDANRKYPVNFPYTFRKSFRLSLTIPEGYVIDEIPKSHLFRLPGKAGEFKWLAQQQGNKIVIVNNIRIDKRNFGVREYENLQNFYTELIQKHESPLVLKKSGASEK